MIIGIGIDCIECKRVMDKINKNDGFREMVFSEEEIAYCEGMKNKSEHYAARFAAKEAMIKALGVGLSSGFDLKDLGIINDENGKPSFIFKGVFDNLIKSRYIGKVHVSLTHLRTTACAMVVLEQ